MDLDTLLARGGLEPAVRLLVLTSVAVWRGDWQLVRECARHARARGRPREDLEEALLQSVLFAGFPRAVTAFETLAETWPAPAPPSGGALPPAEQAAAGEALFAAIYGRNAETVHAMLRGFHRDFHAFVLEVAYGRVLSRPGLEPRIRELMAIGVLAAQQQLPQFVGHARGALHFGATRDEIREVLVSVLGDAPVVDEWLRRVR